MLNSIISKKKWSVNYLKNIFKIIIVLLIAYRIIINAVFSLIDSFIEYQCDKYGIAYHNSKDNKIFHILTYLKDIAYLPIFDFITGFDTGYNFFAPNVASGFYVHAFYISTSNDTMLINKPNFKLLQNEIRFFNWTDCGFDYLDIHNKNHNEIDSLTLKKDDLYLRRYLRIMIHNNLNNRMIDTSTIYSGMIFISLYDYVSLKDRYVSNNKTENEHLIPVRKIELSKYEIFKNIHL